MRQRSFPLSSSFLLAALMGAAVAADAAPPTNAQKCEAAVELASAKFAQCRLTVESKAAKGALVGQKLTDALGKCSSKLTDAYAKAVTKYGVDCAVTEPSAAFDSYLTQCSDDATAAAGGASLPDYVGDLASCNADLATCNGDLSTCTADLATASANLAACSQALNMQAAQYEQYLAALQASYAAQIQQLSAQLSTCQQQLDACLQP